MFKAVRDDLLCFRLMLGLLLAGVMLTGCGPKPDTHPGQPVTKRKAIFHNMLRAFEPMGLEIRGRESYDKDKFLKNAVNLEALAQQPWSYFTPGSDYRPTRAKHTVWEKPADFKAKQQKLLETVTQLTRASQTGNMDVIRPAYQAVAQTCKACHDQFRQSSY